MISYISNSADETCALGKALGRQLALNSVVCFFGDLGAGKTTLIKGLAASITGNLEKEVNSPTFTYLNIYQDSNVQATRGMTLYHFDLYRLNHPEEFLDMGFDELFFAGGICCIEWAERITALNFPAIKVKMTSIDEKRRGIEISGIENEQIFF
jgi:tRNA threonylcarbamoyladenosine biosynthesis protein TsaE